MQRPIDQHTALIFTMVLISAAEGEMTDAELDTIGRQVRYLPARHRLDVGRLRRAAARGGRPDLACDMIAEALPQHLREPPRWPVTSPRRMARWPRRSSKVGCCAGAQCRPAGRRAIERATYARHAIV
jgi:hypothetical protein